MRHGTGQPGPRDNNGRGTNTKRAIVLALVALVLASLACGGGSSTTAVGPTFGSSSISDLECTHDSIGNAILTGSFTNTSQTTVSFVQAEGRITETQGGPAVSSHTTYVDAETVRPGDSGRFTVYVDDPHAQMRFCNVRVVDFHD